MICTMSDFEGEYMCVVRFIGLAILLTIPMVALLAGVVDVTHNFIGKDGYEFAPITVREYIDGKAQENVEFWAFKIFPSEWCKDDKQEIWLNRISFFKRGLRDEGNYLESNRYEMVSSNCGSNEWTFTTDFLGYDLSVYLKIETKNDGRYGMRSVYLTDFRAVGVYVSPNGKPQNIEYKIAGKAENKNIKIKFNGYLDAKP
jgi:hypothetical protein